MRLCSDATSEELLRAQERLQIEADQVLDDLDLGRLQSIGRPVRVGSSALGLMVRPDVDITVVCTALDASVEAAVADLGAQLIKHPRVRVVTMRDDTGPWNTDPGYPDGRYLGVTYRSPSGRSWTLDLWFVDEPDRQPDLAHVRDLPPRLTDEARAAILMIKHAWADNPGYGSRVTSFDVYSAVLDHGVRTPGDFGSWLTDRS